MPRIKRNLSKEELQACLEANPDVTLGQLKTIFHCGSETITRELRRHGLRTKPRSARVFATSVETRRKMSEAHQGSKNANFGEKARPWLEGDEHPLRKWHKEHPEFGEGQRGKSNPVHRVKHLYADASYVARITSGIRAHANVKKGSTYENIYGEEKAAAYKTKLRDASPARLAKFERKTTWPELTIRRLLEELGATFVEQYPIGPYTVDFFVPSVNLVVQADGDYWHANPSIFTQPTNKQSRRRQLDASCNTFLRNRGFRVLRLWESSLHADIQGCKQLIGLELQ